MADRMINIALPKGRLGMKVYEMFEKAGFECPSMRDQGRKLIFENEEACVRYFLVKPSDVPIYVERGAADIGVAGKDILLEYAPDVYELVDLKTGICDMCVAAMTSYRDDPDRTLRVATKFPEIAKRYYGKNREVSKELETFAEEIANIEKKRRALIVLSWDCYCCWFVPLSLFSS